MRPVRTRGMVIRTIEPAEISPVYPSLTIGEASRALHCSTKTLIREMRRHGIQRRNRLENLRRRKRTAK